MVIALRNAGAPHAARSVVKATTPLHKDYLTASPETQSTETPPSTDQAVVNVIVPQKLDEPQINQVVFFLLRAGTDQEETESSKKKQYVDFEISVYHENLVTISCFHTFLIFIQSYIFNFCIYFKCFFLYLMSMGKPYK